MGTVAELQQNVESVQERMATACGRSGRACADVTLVAVTKTIDVAVAAVLPHFRIYDLGESRPQELRKKVKKFSAAEIPNVRWHLIGHLQRNKIDRTLPLVQLIHSVDSERLLIAIDETAARLDRAPEVLLQFNLSREPQKSGFAVDNLPTLIDSIGRLRHVQVRGLMTMAALSDDPERSRPVFAELRGLRDRMKNLVTPPHTLEHLSMGMSQDFEVAIEEGATLVRIGSALFEGLT